MNIINIETKDWKTETKVGLLWFLSISKLAQSATFKISVLKHGKYIDIFAEKNALQKLLTFLQQKISTHLKIP